LRLWFNMARFAWARRRDFDVLHSHGAYFTNAFVGPLARVLGLRSVIKASLAHDDLHGLGRGITGRLHRFMLSCIDACVAISRDLVDEFKAGGLDLARIHHLPNGVDTARFMRASPGQRASMRAAMHLPPDRAIALYVGVLDQRKNILWLAEQWVTHGGFGTGALLLAVGPQARDDPDGVLRQRLADLARAHPDLFMLHDFHADVAAYYRCADLLILPSAREGLPNVVLEAMASGLPCVAARASGSKELIVEGETGHTFEPDDANDLARALRACLSDKGAAMGEAAWKLAQRRYSIPAIADAYESIYTSLLAGRPVIAPSGRT
jgi:glycosyltransferase involved in cell wall biosynthesis